MARTAASLYGVFRDMSLTGVTNLNEPPRKLDTAQYPCKWVHTARIEEGKMRAKGVGGERLVSCVVVVAVGVAGQDTHAQRHAAMLAMVDTLNAGIKATGVRGISWAVEANPAYGDIYMAAVAEITEAEWQVG
jgi:hypothetical protein